jgi:lipopolysaccharide export system protein LptA
MSFYSGGGFASANPINYEWVEEKTILTGNNDFTLTNIVPAGGEVLMVDKKYGHVWSEPEHFGRVNQIITLTEAALSEDLTFRIFCFLKT